MPMRVSDTDIRRLRVFVAVSECRSFAVAAVQTSMSQSSVSEHVKALEERLRCRLCTRGRGGFRLTTEGEAVLLAARNMLASLDRFEAEIDNIHATPSGSLRIGLLDNMITDPSELVSDVLERFDKRGLRTRLIVDIVTPDQAEQRLLDDNIDVAISCHGRFLKALSYTKLYSERHSLYCSARHRLFAVADDDLSPQHLVRERTVVRNFGRDIEPERHPQGTVAAVVNNIEAQAFLIMSAGYIGYLPDHYASRWVRQGLMRALKPLEFSYLEDIYCVVRPRTLASKFVASFVADVQGAARSRNQV